LEFEGSIAVPRGSPPRRPHIGSPEPGDEVGPYSWLQLEAMNEKLRRALTRAIERVPPQSDEAAKACRGDEVFIGRVQNNSAR
jgi:hypothetical protein